METFLAKRQDWTLERFQDRLKEVSSKLQSELRDNKKEKLTREEGKLQKVLDLCRAKKYQIKDIVFQKYSSNSTKAQQTSRSDASVKRLKRADTSEETIVLPLKCEAKLKQKECLNCRGYGHMMKHCPLTIGKSEEQKCYRCGEKDHALSHCRVDPLPEGQLPFATCFICGETGHLAAKCKENSHGVYPKGGCCFRCESIYHLAKDCPMRSERLQDKRQNRQAKRQRESDEKKATRANNQQKMQGKQSSTESSKKPEAKDDIEVASQQRVVNSTASKHVYRNDTTNAWRSRSNIREEYDTRQISRGSCKHRPQQRKGPVRYFSQQEPSRTSLDVSSIFSSSAKEAVQRGGGEQM